MYSEKFIYKCTDCSREFRVTDVKYLCPVCSKQNSTKAPPKGVFKTLYDYQEIQKKISGFDELKNCGFIDILPIRNTESLPGLRVGRTPLYTIDKLNGENYLFLFI